jgi:hypothetical protein
LKGSVPPGKPRAAVVSLRNGGGGGASSANDQPGGNGGNVAIQRHPGTTIRGADRARWVDVPAAITLLGYATGGAGYSDCRTTPPVNGTNGGSGANLNIIDWPYTTKVSFDGGLGGDGVPAGKGGPGGSANRPPAVNTGSFRNAGDGKTCPGEKTAPISAPGTWTHNPELGKSRVCVDVSTTPPQSFVSAAVSGPSGSATLAKTPLANDGTIQLSVVITQAGTYTWTVAVYDQSGSQTATTTTTVDVQPPPTNGPTLDPPCQAPTQ